MPIRCMQRVGVHRLHARRRRRVEVGAWSGLGPGRGRRGCRSWCNRLPCVRAPPPRRTLPGLPRLLRPAGRELLDEHRPAHQRRLRLHLDADQRAARRGSRPTSAVAFDVSRKTFRTERVRRVQGRPLGHPDRVLRPGAAAARGARRAADPARRGRGLRGRRRHRHPHHPGRRAGHGGAHLHRRPRRVPAGHRQGHACSTPCKGVSEVWPDGPRRGRGEVPRAARALQRPRRARRRVQRQPARRARGRPEDRRQVARPVRRPRPGSSPTSTRSRARPGESLREHLDGVLRNRRLNQLVRDLELPARRRRPRAPELGPRAGAHRSSTASSSGCCATGSSSTSRPRRRRPSAASSSRARCSTPDEVRRVAGRARRAPARRSACTSSATGRGGTGDVSALALATGERRRGIPRPDHARPEQATRRSRPGWPTPTRPRCCTTPRGRCWRWRRGAGTLAGIATDTALAAYLVRPDQRSYDLADLVLRHLGRELRAETDGRRPGHARLRGRRRRGGARRDGPRPRGARPRRRAGRAARGHRRHRAAARRRAAARARPRRAWSAPASPPTSSR